MRAASPDASPPPSPGLSQVSASSQSLERSAFPFAAARQSAALEESRFVCLAEARAQLRRQAGLPGAEAAPPGLLQPGWGLEEHSWLARRAGGDRFVRARRRLRVVVFGPRHCGQAELAALLCREGGGPRKTFYQGRLRTTVCRVRRATEDVELKVVEFPVLDDACRAWESLERALERGLELTAQQRTASPAEDCCVG